MRLIDANETLRLMSFEEYKYQYEEHYGYRQAEKFIELQPTVEAIPIEWMRNKRDELEKEYYDLFHAYTDEGTNNQVQLLNDFHAFNTVLRYWEKENETNKC